MRRKDAEFEPAEEEQPTRGEGRGRGVKILHIDDAVIVVDKSPLIGIEPGFSDDPSVIERLEAEADLSDEGSLFPVCPLANEASGMLLIARDEETHAQLVEQINARTLEQVHAVLVRGRPMQESGTIEKRLFDNRPGGGYVRIDENHGKPAMTEWRVLDAFIEFALLECIPRTAIDQQIRPHLSHIGMPLVVDPAYGGGRSLMLSSFKAKYHPSKRRPERPLIQRLSLHVQTLRLNHPKTNEPMELHAEWAKDFRAAVHQLGRFGRIT